MRRQRSVDREKPHLFNVALREQAIFRIPD